MRLFVAVDPTAEIHARIVQFREQARLLAPQAKFVRSEGLHVTLKFIGEVSDPAVERVKDALATIKGSAFEIRFKGFGFFPNAVRPAHFWIGVNGGEPLHSLAYMVNKELAQIGIEEEEKKFTPHLTLARSSRRVKRHPFGELQHKIGPMANHDFGRMKVSEFFLYSSKLSPGGSTYNKVARFAL